MHIWPRNKGTSQTHLHEVEELPLAVVFFLLAGISLKSKEGGVEQESISLNSSIAPFCVLFSIASEVKEMK